MEADPVQELNITNVDKLISMVIPRDIKTGTKSPDLH